MSKVLSTVLACLFLAGNAFASTGTKVVMLGTGTPVPDYKRAGPGIAVVYNGEAYLFDTGAGTVRNAITAQQKFGIEELDPTRIKYVFYTHLHSDHTIDFAELVQTYWWRKDFKIQVYGPREIEAMAKGMDEMMASDVQFRIESIQPVKRKDAAQVDVHPIEAGGVVYQSEGITIEAFVVPHGEFKPAFGYKVSTPDKTIVISGDTAFSEDIIDKAKGADVLLHEVISQEGLNKLSKFWQDYHLAYHTPTGKVAEIANRAKPGLLVLYHALFYGAPEDSVLKEIKQLYDGEVVLANDLDVF